MSSGNTLSDLVLFMRRHPPSETTTWTTGFVVRSLDDLPRDGDAAIIRKMSVAAQRYRHSRAGRTRMPAFLDFSPMSAHRDERIDTWMLRCVAVLEGWLLGSPGELPVLPRCPHCTPAAPCDRPRRKRDRR